MSEGTTGGGARARIGTALAAALALAVVGGCANGTGPGPVPGAPEGRILQCKAGDTRVASEGDCLQDDAACYALAGGGFCTGERGNTCPAGSRELPAGAPCPPGARCFAVGESLSCTIG